MNATKTKEQKKKGKKRRQVTLCTYTSTCTRPNNRLNLSHEEPVLSGLPQGTVLGPLLFLTYINDLPNVLSAGTRVRLFEGDSLIYRKIKSIDDTKILQDINKLEQWESDWKMEFHPEKCKLMTITNKRIKVEGEYFSHG